MKRGQVTQFIIAGLIILIAVIFIISARLDYVKDLFEQQKTKLSGVPDDIKPIENYLQNCFGEMGDDAITLVMLQGGYLYPNLDPGQYKEYTSIDIAYWYYGEEDLSPDINDIENNLAYYADEILPTCIDSISENYEFNEYNLSYNQIETNVNIKGDNFIFNSDINLNIEYKGKNYKIDKLTSSGPVKNIERVHTHAISQSAEQPLPFFEPHIIIGGRAKPIITNNLNELIIKFKSEGLIVDTFEATDAPTGEFSVFFKNYDIITISENPKYFGGASKSITYLFDPKTNRLAKPPQDLLNYLNQRILLKPK